MKKIASFILIICMLSGTMVVQAETITSSNVEEVVKSLGIISGDENGNMNLSNAVTRAEFVKMLVSASTYKDQVGTSENVSLFSDVKYNHWASQYIKTAIDAGWVQGYLDGSFKPNNTMTIEEGVTAILRALGYTSDNLIGKYPQAQMAKYHELDLDDKVGLETGALLTREACLYLFYNLLGAQTYDGDIYGETLGYIVDQSGNIDYMDIILGDLNDPVVVTDFIGESLQFVDWDSAVVYKDGYLASQSDIRQYDVAYYNENMNILWVYSEKVVGVCSEINYDETRPQSIVVGGNTYTFLDSNVAYKFSVMGTYAVGDSVSLLLGMNDEIVEVIDIDLIDEISYGVVTEIGVDTLQDQYGKSQLLNSISIACTDGIVRSFNLDESSKMTVASISEGDMVSVTYSNGDTIVEKLSEKNISGEINAAVTEMGGRKLAENLEIIDIAIDGSYKVVYPSRLAGKVLHYYDVKYYTLDTNNKVDRLILDNVTGDMETYGIITKVKENVVRVYDDDGTVLSKTTTRTVKYLIGDSEGSLNSSDKDMDLSTGGVMFKYDDGMIDEIEPLRKITVSQITSSYALSGSYKYTLSEDIIVYYKDVDGYHKTSLSAVKNLADYRLYGYYDSSYSLGEVIRIIIAYEE